MKRWRISIFGALVPMAAMATLIGVQSGVTQSPSSPGLTSGHELACGSYGCQGGSSGQRIRGGGRHAAEGVGSGEPA